jgi:hypothetical protein
MDHAKNRTRRTTETDTSLPTSTHRRLWVRLMPALAVAAGVFVFQAVRSDRGNGDHGPSLSAAERATRVLLQERTAAHLRALRPR